MVEEAHGERGEAEEWRGAEWSEGGSTAAGSWATCGRGHGSGPRWRAGRSTVACRKKTCPLLLFLASLPPLLSSFSLSQVNSRASQRLGQGGGTSVNKKDKVSSPNSTQTHHLNELETVTENRFRKFSFRLWGNFLSVENC